MKRNNGILVAIEGIDGSGKSTLITNLATKLTPAYPDLVLTREPGGTPLGQQIRHLLQQQPVPICPLAEYLLFAADRAQHMHEKIAPALAAGKLVLTDRMGDSSLVYQGYARGINKQQIRATNDWAQQDIAPNITIWVDIPVSVAQERWRMRNATNDEEQSAFEAEHQDFMHKARDGFAHLYADRADVIVIDGTLDKNQMLEQAYTQLIAHLKTYEQ